MSFARPIVSPNGKGSNATESMLQIAGNADEPKKVVAPLPAMTPASLLALLMEEARNRLRRLRLVELVLC